MTSNSSKDLVDWDKHHIWHPFTQMQVWQERDPIIIERAEGSYLIDIHGKRYLDGVSSLWVTVHGHNHPHVVERLKMQLDQLDHSTLLGLANVPSIELAKRLVEITPSGLNKVFYSDSGSTANEVAIKIAFQYWQQKNPTKEVPNPKHKKRFIALEHAYHGDTIGSGSVWGIGLFHKVYHPLLVETI